MVATVGLSASPPVLAQSRTTTPTPRVAIKVSIGESRVVVTPDSVQRGLIVIFVITNDSKHVSQFTIARVTTKPLMPRGRALLRVTFLTRGTFPFSAREDGTRFHPHGTLIVF